MCTDTKRTADDDPTYQVRVSKRFIILSLLSSLLLAFGIGRTARILLIVGPQRQWLEQKANNLLQLANGNTNDHVNHVTMLPNPVLQAGKVAPQTLYTSKNFNTAGSASINSRFVEPSENQNQCAAASEESITESDSEMDDEVHLPVGQHLLLDIKNVDSSFLSSEDRLANAMLEVVYECGLTLLSYHCHGLQPSGVSCVGVLLESHVSFHTWPSHGVITLDLFTCGPSSLLPIVSTVERLFSVPITSSNTEELVDQPEAIWAYKVRGFGGGDAETTAELTDLFTFPIGAMTDYKKEIASVDTGHQRVDIYDVLRPQVQTLESYKRSLRNDDSYESQNPASFQPDRIVFIDGVLQSRRFGEVAYHESFVHPAMFAHKHPGRVAVIGGGDGAILREVLKHSTVKEVVFIEKDDKIINLTKEHVPEYSDCGSLLGVTKNCYDDPRVQIVHLDLKKWLTERFSGKGEEMEEAFDVIIMDEMDYIYEACDDDSFLKSLSDLLAPEGIFLAQVGEAPDLMSPPQEHSAHKSRGRFIRELVNLGFESVRDFEEGHNGFWAPWQHICAFKAFDTRAAWFNNEANVNMEIHKRATPTVNGDSPFLYYDSATHQSFLYPSKASEIVYCRGDPTPNQCKEGRGFEPQRPGLSRSSVLEGNNSEDTYRGKEYIYNPAAERQPHFYGASTPLRDISKGKELLIKHLAVTNPHEAA